MKPLVYSTHLDEGTQMAVTPEQLRGLLRGAILMDREYQQLHGYSEDDAIYSAINEMTEGLAAEIELAENGELELKSCQLLPLNPAEAVYGFAGWLTSRDEQIVMSSRDDASPVANAVKEFIDANKLGDVSEQWPNNLIHPTS